MWFLLQILSSWEMCKAKNYYLNGKRQIQNLIRKLQTILTNIKPMYRIDPMCIDICNICSVILITVSENIKFRYAKMFDFKLIPIRYISEWKYFPSIST